MADFDWNNADKPAPGFDWGNAHKPNEEPAAPSPFGGGRFGGRRVEQRQGGNIVKMGGASGSWGLPDPGLFDALRVQFQRGMSKDSADEALAAAFSANKLATPGAYLRMPDGTEVPVPTKGDMFRAARDSIRMEQDAAEEHWPKAGFAARMGGELASDYALAGTRAASRTYQTLSGMYRGLMGNNADLTPGQITPENAGSAALSTGLNALISNQAPVALDWLGKTRAAQYLGGKLSDIINASGNGLQNLAGWLKVNSIHPTPTLGEAMADVPGGVPAVGRELLARRIGGWTQAGTKKQVEAAFEDAGKVANQLAADHTATGAPVELGDALSAARAKAEGLMQEPATREAGEKLLNLVNSYAEKYGAGEVAPATAAEALATKRALGDIGYGAQTEFALNKNPVVGNYGAGVRSLERGVNDTLTQELGPRYTLANLVVRRLGGAKQAAERAAAKTTGNQLIGLLPYLAGIGGAASGGGGAGAVTYGLGSLLAAKYGPQVAARTLYGLGAGLKSAPGFLLEQGAPMTGASVVGTRLRDLLDNDLPLMSPAYGQDRSR